MDVAADPFDAGPFPWMDRPLPLAPSCEPSAWRPGRVRVGVASLGARGGLAIGAPPRESVLLDYAAYGRYLVAAPAFAGASTYALPLLALVVRHFADSGVMRRAHR